MLSNETFQNNMLIRPNSKSTRVPFVVPVKDSLSTQSWLNNSTSLNRLLSAHSDKSKSLTIMRPESIKRANNDACMAAAIGDLEWLKQSLRVSSEMAFDKNGLSTVHLASIHCKMNVMKFLIEERSVDSNYPSANGWRPIHLVISAKNGKDAVECLHYLIEQGAEINSKNEDNVTPLHQAASEGHFDCLRILLDHKADPFVLDYRNQMPLDLAKLWGHKKCAKLLAASMWHTEKVLSFKQESLNKRLRTQDVLLEIERAHTILHDETKKAKKSTQHFDSWLNQQSFIKPNSKTSSAKSLTTNDKPPLAPINKKLPKLQSTYDDGNDNNYDNNYDTNPRRAPPKIRIDEGSATNRQQLFTQRSALRSAATHSEMLYSSQDLNETTKQQQQRPTLHTQVTEPNMKWDYSTKVEEKEYTKNLDDFYPRDPYTKLPPDPDLLLLHHQLSGLSLDEVKQFMKMNLSQRAKMLKEKQEKIETTKSKSQNSLKGAAKKQAKLLKHSASSVAVSGSERPVYYKPKFVLDYESKAMVKDCFDRVDNAAFALCDDPKSFFYKETTNIVQQTTQAPVPLDDTFKKTIELYYDKELYDFMRTKNGKVNPKYEKVFIC